MPIIVDNKKAKDDITKLDGLEEMKWAVKLELVTTSWHNVYNFFIESNNMIGDELKGWIENKNQGLCKDKNYNKEEYSGFFQSLYELESLTDTVYTNLCKLGYKLADVNSAILNLSYTKLLMLIQSGIIKYDLRILKLFHEICATLSCEYIFYYKNNLSEMLSTDIMNSELAEALLIRKGFSTEDYALIIASLTSENVRMNKDIANRFCALQAEQYTVCDENIFYDAINLCNNEHDAVFAAGQKIIQSQKDFSVIDTIISKLPDTYHDLKEANTQVKIKNTNYNKFFTQALKDSDYILSSSTKNGKIIIQTKEEL